MDIRLLIGGADTSAVSGAIFERKDPVTGDVAARAAPPSRPTSTRRSRQLRRHFRSGRKPGRTGGARFS